MSNLKVNGSIDFSSLGGGAIKLIVDLIYPTGSYFITDQLKTAADVKAHFGNIGEWEPLDEGTFLEATKVTPTKHNPGLPNIKGSANIYAYDFNNNKDGCFTNSWVWSSSAGGGGTVGNAGKLEFNANTGAVQSGIYRDDCYTVQPKSQTVYIYRRKS